uniref:Uncharacterized protein n=2 Tax=viral metagenome TaxID=1070528 RepID=A0A6M3KW31_9ZZZZ
MSGELKHATVGTTMTQAEFEAVGLHVVDSQATGDLIYASSNSQLSRLGIGSTGALLTVSSGIPAWTSYTITNDGTKTTIAGISGDYWRVGDAAATSRSLASEDDLMVTGKLEVDGISYLDGTVFVADTKTLVVGHSATIATQAGNADTFQVLGGGISDGSLTLAVFRNALTQPPAVHFLKSYSNGDLGVNTIVVDNAELGAIMWMAADGVDFRTIGAKIVGIVNGTPDANDMPTDIEFYTALGATADDLALKMTLDKSGNLLLASGYFELPEVSAPGAGAANTARIYAQDNGAGKTQIMAQFATGAAQQIAIEP